MSQDHGEKMKRGLVKASSTSLTQSGKAIDIAHKLLFQDIEFDFNEGFKKMNSRKIRNSTTNFLQLIESNPNFFNETHLEFEAECDQDYKDALELFNKVLEIKPNHFYSIVFLAICQRMLNEIEASLCSLNKAISIKPNHFLGYLHRGISKSKYYSKDGNYDFNFFYFIGFTSFQESIEDYGNLLINWDFYKNQKNKTTSDLWKEICLDFQNAIDFGFDESLCFYLKINSSKLAIHEKFQTWLLEYKYRDKEIYKEYYLNLFESLIRKYPLRINIKFELAQLYIFHAGLYRTEDTQRNHYLTLANDTLDECIRHSKFHYQGEAILLKAIIHAQLKEFNHSLNLCNSIILKEFKNAYRAYFLCARIYLIQEKIHDAINCLNISKNLNPHYLPTRILLSLANSSLCNFDALIEIENIIESSSEIFQLHSNRDLILYEKLLINIRGKIKLNLGDLEGGYLDYPELHPDYNPLF